MYITAWASLVILVMPIVSQVLVSHIWVEVSQQRRMSAFDERIVTAVPLSGLVVSEVP